MPSTDAVLVDHEREMPEAAPEQLDQPQDRGAFGHHERRLGQGREVERTPPVSRLSTRLPQMYHADDVVEAAAAERVAVWCRRSPASADRVAAGMHDIEPDDLDPAAS